MHFETIEKIASQGILLRYPEYIFLNKSNYLERRNSNPSNLFPTTVFGPNLELGHLFRKHFSKEFRSRFYKGETLF